MKHVDALWVVGAEYMVDENMGVVKRILLPDPNCQSLIAYGETVDESSIQARIKATIDRALKQPNTKIGFCPHFTGFSINLVDTNQITGWAHVEFVLPYSRPMKRPAVKIYKKRCPEVVDELQRIFNELWDNRRIIDDKDDGL